MRRYMTSRILHSPYSSISLVMNSGVKCSKETLYFLHGAKGSYMWIIITIKILLSLFNSNKGAFKAKTSTKSSNSQLETSRLLIILSI